MFEAVLAAGLASAVAPPPEPPRLAPCPGGATTTLVRLPDRPALARSASPGTAELARPRRLPCATLA